MKEFNLEQLQREDSLDLIQKYVEEKLKTDSFEKNNISSEMFRLFYNVIELGREVRLSLKNNSNNKITEAKIADIFLVLVSICNSLHINLFEALIKTDYI